MTSAGKAWIAFGALSLSMGCVSTHAYPGPERAASEVARVVGGNVPVRVTIAAVGGAEQRGTWVGGRGVVHLLPGEHEVTLRCDRASFGASLPEGLDAISCGPLGRRVRVRFEAGRRYIFYSEPIQDRWWLWAGSREPRDLRERLPHDAKRCTKDPHEEGRLHCPL